MKYFIPSIVIIILFVSACDKYDISSKQSETFARFYGVGLEDEGIKVISMSEGYLIMANVENPGSGRDICIITTDENGNTTAPILTIGGASDDIGYAIKPNSMGYIIAGSTRASENADIDPYVIQLGPNGTFEWERQVFQPNNNEAYDVLIEDNGELVFTGYTESGEATTQRDVLFLKTNATADSTLVFEKLGSPQADEEAFSLAFWQDATYLFAGYQRSSTGTKDISLWRWNGITSPLVSYYKTDGNSVAKSIINSDTESKFLVACNNELSQNESNILFFETSWKINLDSVDIKVLGEQSMNSVQSMDMRGNSVYLCGTSSSGELNYGDMLLIQTTKEGTNPQYLYIGDGVSYTGSGFDLTNDNGYVITGASYLNEKSMISIYKVNSEGNL